MKKILILLASLSACLMFSACGQSEAAAASAAENATLKTIFARKSVRKYTPRPVEKQTLELLVRAGMAAPSGKNVQPWSFVIVTDEAVLKKFGQSGNSSMAKDAKAAIVVCGNPSASELWMLDCSAAAQNILLAAESVGLGAVWTAGYPYPERIKLISEILGLPKETVLLNIIVIGYPAGNDQPKNKWDPAKVHYDKW